MPEFIPTSTQQIAEAKKHHTFSPEHGYKAAKYQREEYPKYKYHRDDDQKRQEVKTAEAEAELGPEWIDQRNKKSEKASDSSPKDLQEENRQLKSEVNELRKLVDAATKPAQKSNDPQESDD